VKKAAGTNECTSVAGRFDSHAEALKQYMRHQPMQHDQGYIGSHWTPPSGDYSFRIASAAARATINKTMMQHATLMAILMAMAVRQYYTPRIARWRRFVAFLKSNKHRHRASTCSNIIMYANAGCFGHFIKKRGPVDMLARNNNRGVQYQTDEKHLTNLPEHFVGVDKLAIYC